MSYHIKRDGGWLCNGQSSQYYNRIYGDQTISFKEAHSMELNDRFCAGCVKRYYDIVSNLKDPLVLEDKLGKISASGQKKKEENKFVPGIDISDSDNQSFHSNEAPFESPTIKTIKTILRIIIQG